jgi:threonine/homoserine/homoserine lactone efflux protein
MPPHDKLALFFTATLILLLTPGPAVLFIVARSVEQGRRAGVVSALGITCGTFFHIAAAALGLSALLVSSAALFNTVKYCGAAYLLILGLLKFFSRTEEETPAALPPQPLRRIYSQGVLVNILNPKTGVFFLAFLPQFVEVGRGSVAFQVAMLGTTFAVMGLTSDMLYALAAGALASRLRSSPRFSKRLRYVSGAVYMGLGLAAAAGARDH